MRLNSFESAGRKFLGEGNEKKVFINPEDENRVISEIKEGSEKDTPRELKGRYYLTKIIHLLLPKNIPDVHQVEESSSGKQTIDTSRISHTKEHSLLQEMRQPGSGSEEGFESAKKMIVDDMGAEMHELDLKLEQIGLGFNIDPFVGNYTKDEAGNVHYLETFKPWQVDVVNKKDLEVLFNEESLRSAIEEISDPGTKEVCLQYLERLLTLLAEERQELQKS